MGCQASTFILSMFRDAAVVAFKPEVPDLPENDRCLMILIVDLQTSAHHQRIAIDVSAYSPL